MNSRDNTLPGATRRLWLGSVVAAAGASLGGLAGCSTISHAAASAVASVQRMAARKARVVVVGGGFGGATCAKYLRLFSDQLLDVTVVEPDKAFTSCPVSNLVLSGQRSMSDLVVPYHRLVGVHGVHLVRSLAVSVDTANRTVTLADGSQLPYDRLVLSPGIELMLNRIEGLTEARAARTIVQAWKAGAETALLRQQLEAMPDGGTFAIAIPEAPYRCPPGPYERASVIAAWMKRERPKSKVLVFDANMDVTSKGALFKAAWASEYAGMLEYRPQHRVIAVDAATRTLKFDFHDDVQADVLNVLPPMRAGKLAVQSGLATANGRWCEVDFRSFESVAAKNVHVIGDSIQTAELMPKSGHMANAQAKVCAAAITAQLFDQVPDPNPMLTNTCYSYVDDSRAMHVASVHRYDSGLKTFLPVPGAGGLSAAPNEEEARLADSWARNIWADMLA